MNPRLGLELWCLLGVGAIVAALVNAWVVNGLESLLDELRRYSTLYTVLSCALTVVAGPISVAWAAAYILRNREERREFEARRARIDADHFERLNQEFEWARERMAGCAHERTVTVDYGMGLVTDKCVTCWAFRLPDGSWAANMSPPP